MAGICSLRTLCTIGCLMVALLAGGSVRAITFRAIEFVQPSWALTPIFASPLVVSADGLRVGGLVVNRDVDFDCGSFLGCTHSFTWTLPQGTTLDGENMGPWGTLPERAEQVVGVSSNHTLFNTMSGPVLLDVAGVETTIPREGRQWLVARAMSHDGTTVVGTMDDFATGERLPFHWTPDGGLQLIPLAIGIRTGATALSEDGKVVAGPGFRWTQTSGTEVLPDFSIEAITGDGGEMVGYAADFHDATPLRWTTETGVSPLELPSKARGGAAFDVTRDSGIVVGQIYEKVNVSPLDGLYSGLLLPQNGLIFLDPAHMALSHQAVFWQDGQVHNLQTWLTQNHNLGPQLAGWSLISANAISAGGRVIAGVGINPEGDFQGWVVDIGPTQVVPEPATSVVFLTSLSLIIAGWTLTRRHG